MKKWALGIGSSVIVIWALVGFRDHMVKVWAAPAKVETLTDSDERQQNTLDNVVELLREQKADTEAQKQVTAVQVESLNRQLEIIAELKKKR